MNSDIQTATWNKLRLWKNTIMCQTCWLAEIFAYPSIQKDANFSHWITLQICVTCMKESEILSLYQKKIIKLFFGKKLFWYT